MVVNSPSFGSESKSQNLVSLLYFLWWSKSLLVSLSVTISFNVSLSQTTEVLHSFLSQLVRSQKFYIYTLNYKIRWNFATILPALQFYMQCAKCNLSFLMIFISWQNVCLSGDSLVHFEHKGLSRSCQRFFLFTVHGHFLLSPLISTTMRPV